MKRIGRVFLVFGLAVFLLAMSSLASAEAIFATKEQPEVRQPFYIGVFGGGVIPDDLKLENGTKSYIQLENSWTAGAKLGYIFPFRWIAAELEYAYLGTHHEDDPGNLKYKAQNAMFNLILRYPEGVIRPFIGAGAGYSWGSFESGITGLDKDEGAFGWQAFGGLNLAITNWLSFDAGYKYFQSKYGIDSVDATIRDHIVFGGFNFHFGTAPPPPAPTPAPPPAPAPKPVVQERKAEPAAAAPVVAEVKDVDSDGDGVVDRLDKCPDTPKGCPVDKDGCPLDSDGDGVIDCKDKCPGTPAGAKVDENGCPVFAVIRLNVEFDFNKAVVKPQYMENIRKVADFMKRHPNLNATIEGHTDNIGTANYNLALSKKRAEAVKNVLIKQGVDAKRLTSAGFGMTKPIAPNNTAAGRAKNRRVQAVLEAQEFKDR